MNSKKHDMGKSQKSSQTFASKFETGKKKKECRIKASDSEISPDQFERLCFETAERVNGN